jgi:enolase-phosphatase E1
MIRLLTARTDHFTNLATMKHLLLDIEGTTTPIAFVYDTLFPYARKHLGDFLIQHADEEAVRETVEMLDSDAKMERAEELECPRLPADGSTEERAKAAAEIALTLMKRDRKATGLKRLQGQVWKNGYESGNLKGELFREVADWLEHWSRKGRAISIYSSGSIEAQKLLFRHSEAGDLTEFLSRHFDTTTGSKKESESYLRIAEDLERKPHDVVFCTDSLQEARAADAAGMQVVMSIRPGNSDPGSHAFPEIHDFDELDAYLHEIESGQ